MLTGADWLRQIFRPGPLTAAAYLAAASLLPHLAFALESPPAWRDLSERTRARMHEMDEIIRDRNQERSYQNYLEIFADDVVAHGLLESGDTGIDGLRTHYRPVFFELKDGVLLSDEVIVAGNMAAQRYHSLLYLAGEFDGVAGQLQPVFLRGQTFFRFDNDGRIAERWSNHDHAYRLGQLLGADGRAAGDRITRHLNGPGLSEAEVLDKLEQLLSAFNRMEAPAERDSEFLQFFESRSRIHGLDEESVGLAELQQQLRELWAAVPDLQMTIHARLSAWSMAAFRWQALGSQRNAYRERDPHMRPVSLTGDWILRFDGAGRITEAWLDTSPIQFDHAH